MRDSRRVDLAPVEPASASRNLKVAIVTTSFFAVGGAENVIRTLAPELVTQGDEVVIFTRDYCEDQAHSLRLDYEVAPLPANIFHINLANIFRNWTTKKKVLSQMSKFDVVIFFMMHTALALFPMMPRSRWIISSRGNDMHNPEISNYKRLVANSEYAINYKGFRTKKINNFILRLFFALNKNGWYTSNSLDICREFASFGVSSERIMQIRNGVDIARFDALRALNRARIAELRAAARVAGRFLVVAIGRNSSQKGYYYLISAAEELRRIGVTDVLFVVHGRGYGRFAKFVAQKSLQDYFLITELESDFLDGFAGDDGRLPDAKTACLYEIADCVVVPSIMEGFPNVGLEAEAANKPILASNGFGVRELIERGTALGFQCGDPVDLARQLIRLRGEPALAGRLAERRKALREDLDSRRFVRDFRQLMLIAAEGAP